MAGSAEDTLGHQLEPPGELTEPGPVDVAEADPEHLAVVGQERGARDDERVVAGDEVTHDLVGAAPGEGVADPAEEPSAAQQLETARPVGHHGFQPTSLL